MRIESEENESVRTFLKLLLDVQKKNEAGWNVWKNNKWEHLSLVVKGNYANRHEMKYFKNSFRNNMPISLNRRKMKFEINILTEILTDSSNSREKKEIIPNRIIFTNYRHF